VTSARARYERFGRLLCEFAKFGVVGVAGLVITNAVYGLLFIHLGAGPVTSATVATIVAAVATYLGNRYWSFRARQRTGVVREVFIFAVLNGIGLLIQDATVAVNYYVLQLGHNELAGFIALNFGIALATLFRFWSYRRFVWVAPPASAAGNTSGRPRPGGRPVRTPPQPHHDGSRWYLWVRSGRRADGPHGQMQRHAGTVMTPLTASAFPSGSASGEDDTGSSRAEVSPAVTDRGGDCGFDYEMIPGGYYDAVYRRRRGIQSKWHHLKFRRVIEEMEGHHRHLDVGCGPGTLIGLLDGRFISTGIDISTAEIGYARRVYESESKRFFAVSARALPDDCRDYDVATVVEVIEHLAPAELGDVLRATIGRLSPGGKLVVTTPNFRSAWPLVQMLVDRFGQLNYADQHINKFTRRRLQQLLVDLGLRDVRVRPYLVLAPFAAPLGWRLADKLARLERGPVERVAGLLLLGTGSKPRDE
jgi:putative flippase GtrA/SAM-dependent methyltransferase